MIMGKCKLCLEEKQLCKSHLVPNSLHKRIKEHDPTTKIVCLSGQYNNGVKSLQSGYSEHMLCKECETVLNRHERIAIPIIKNVQELCEVTRSINPIELQPNGSESLRHTCLSILFKAACSNRAELKHFNIPKNIFDQIRDELLTQNHRMKRLVPIFVTAICGSSLINKTIYYASYTDRFNNHSTRTISIGSLWFKYVITSNAAYISDDGICNAVGCSNVLHLNSIYKSDEDVLQMINEGRISLNKYLNTGVRKLR